MAPRSPILLAFVAALVAAPLRSEALDVQIAGSWSVDLDAGDLAGGAGTDLTPRRDSASSEVVLDVSAAVAASDSWRVDVERSDGAWDASVHVWVRRTSGGTGAGNVFGGDGWVEVTASGTAFFSGEGNRADIGIQLRLTGLSVGLSVDSYATTVTYTVVDTSILALLALCTFDAHAGGLQVIGSLARDEILAPGESATGEITVRNASDESLVVQISSQDYRFAADGSNDFLPPGTLPRSNAAWVTFSPEELVLPPGATSAVSYAMVAPVDVGPGTWWSTLVIEPQPDLVLSDGGLSVRTVVRYAVHLVADVGHPEADVAFVRQALVDDGTTATLQIDLANPGPRMVKPEITIQVHTEEGVLVRTFEADQKRIYPGCSARFPVRLGGLPAGRYEALIVADVGEETVFGVRTTLDLTRLAQVVTRVP